MISTDCNFDLDLVRGNVTRRGRTVHLSPREMELFHNIQVLSPGKRISFWGLHDLLFPYDGLAHDKTLRVMLARLRRKLKPLGLRIDGKRLAGYRLVQCPTKEGIRS